MSQDKLAFLDRALGSRKEFYRESKWCVSDFEDNVWVFVMESSHVGGFQIDFNLVLSNGTMLTDRLNERLLNTFKYWINASVHPDNTRGRGFGYSDSAAKSILVKVLYFIDYFLLNDKHLNISTCGLQALTGDNLKHFADRQATYKFASENIYGWTTRLSDFLEIQLAKADKLQLLRLAEDAPVDFSEITDEQHEKNELSILAESIPLARCWLWQNGFYRRGRNYEYVVNTRRLSELFYGMITLRGASTSKACPPVLCLGEHRTYEREFPCIPVTREDNGILSPTVIQTFKTALRGLFLLSDDVLSCEGLLTPPGEAISAYLDYSPENVISSRFATLPSKVVVDAVRNAIDFHLLHAHPLIVSLESVLHLLKERQMQAKEGARTSISKVITPKEFSRLLHPDIRKIGVERWSIGKLEDRFSALRANKGLAELIRVYYGCVQIVVGALMARRQAELTSLKAGACLDGSKRYLVFPNAKSTRLLEGRRVDVSRPIDEIAVEMIEKLNEIHAAYLEVGFINKHGNLFDSVSLHDPSKMVSVNRYRQSYTQNFDFFCDYFETPLRDGKRFYIRAHQLRRFFALSFFWGSGFGGMDTLRWFMGHADPQHLYHYITENTPGEVLRHAKSQFLAETLDEHTELRALILERFGAADFTLLNTDEMEDYIDELIRGGEVDVQPEFIEDDNGQSYRLLVVIKDRVDA